VKVDGAESDPDDYEAVTNAEDDASDDYAQVMATVTFSTVEEATAAWTRHQVRIILLHVFIEYVRALRLVV
jgi:hypothetical protein